MTKLRFLSIVAAMAICATASPAQTKWYKIDKQFIDRNFPPDSAIGELQASESHPAASVHRVGCGGDDGELHVGIPGRAVLRSNSRGLPVSASAAGPAGDFGIVAEPPNATRQMRNLLAGVQNQQIVFEGYYRVWNEGHDVGAVHPSNPHHVLELHPAWAFRAGAARSGSPAAVFPMANYQGYGASKFRPVLESVVVERWPKAAEDDDFLYVQLKRAENFYQLPVRVRRRATVSGGSEFVVDVYSSAARTRPPVFPGLAVVVADGSPIAGQLRAGQDTFLLGLFSVNPRKALTAARGRRGMTQAVFAREALEFFAFGVPLRPAVGSCN